MENLKSHRIWLTLGVAALALTGCAATNVTYHSMEAMPPPLHPKLTVLRPDAVVSLHTAGGILEPRTDWSEKVADALGDALHSYLFDAGVDFTDAPAGSEDDEYAMRQSINLVLDAVELSMVKGTIGDARTYVVDQTHRKRVADATGADYALALVYRANRSSGGRIAVSALASLAFVQMEMDSTRFRSALIDLRDGHVKWANFDAGNIAGSINPDSTAERQWRKAVELLMREFPL